MHMTNMSYTTFVSAKHLDSQTGLPAFWSLQSWDWHGIWPFSA